MSEQPSVAPAEVRGASSLGLAISMFTAPSEVFSVLKHRPSKLFPLAVVLLGTVLVMGWYFSILDYDWYIDDTLSRAPNLTEEQLENARDAMASLSQRNMAAISMGGSAISLLAIFLAQATYLTFVSALSGDDFRFRHWFSLTAWTSLPHLLVVVTMSINILLSPNGQLSVYELNGLSLRNLGMQTGNNSVDQMLSSLNLSLFWSIALVVAGYRQWLNTSLARALTVVLSPYLIIYGIWTYFATH